MQYLLLNIVLAAIPSALLLFCFLKRDSRKAEPPGLVFRAFLLGFAAVLPALALQLCITPLLPIFSFLPKIFIRAFIIAALVEEGLKLTIVKTFFYPRREFDEIADGIVYTVAASLGFAFFENIFYTLDSPWVLITRGLTAVPLHAGASGIMGFYLGKAKFGDIRNIRTGFFQAVAIHGLYNFFLFTESILALLIIPLLVITLFTLSRLYRIALDEDRKAGRS